MIRKTLFFCILIVALPACASPLDENEQRMVEWIDAHTEDAIALLEEQVNISSGTMNHGGVREVGEVLRRELDALGSRDRVGRAASRRWNAQDTCSGASWTGSGKKVRAHRPSRHRFRGR